MLESMLDLLRKIYIGKSKNEKVNFKITFHFCVEKKDILNES